jgi:hypothetical protein
MIYKGFDINVRVYAYTECTLHDDGEIDCAIDTQTDFEDIVEYVAFDEHANIFWCTSLSELKYVIDKHIKEKRND